MSDNASAYWTGQYYGLVNPVNTTGTAVDASGNIYLAGYFSSTTLVMDGVTLTRIGTQDAFAAKLDSSGNVLWAKNFGGAGASTSGSSIAVDGSGNVYLGGYFQSANLTTPALTKIGSQDAYAIKLDSSGTTTWAKNFGGASANALGYSIAVDGSGNVYLGGYFQTANLTTPALTKIGAADAYAIKLDSSGTTTWAKNFGGTSMAYAYGNSIAVDGSGNVYLGGYFSTANLTTPEFTKQGDTDGFLIKAQLLNTSCTSAGKFKYDSTNNLMVFCDGSTWQSMHNSSASTCTGTTAGKYEYYANGASSDFVWYGGSCKSAKSTTTYGACAVNGKVEWDSGNSTLRGCINGTWTSLKGW